MLSKDQLKTMLKMQNIMNRTVHPNWEKQSWDYMRASALETAEAIEHHGWKWWKAQKMDLPQLQMELVDVFHFYLSRYLQITNGDENKALVLMINEVNVITGSLKFDENIYLYNELSILEKLDLLCGLACAKRLHLGLFFAICKDIDLRFSDIYEQYVQKNTLNIFRQEKGYKQGTYHKEWFDEEDNIYLVKIALTLSSSDRDYAEKLWTNLELKYNEALAYKIAKS